MFCEMDLHCPTPQQHKDSSISSPYRIFTELTTLPKQPKRTGGGQYERVPLVRPQSMYKTFAGTLCSFYVL